MAEAKTETEKYETLDLLQVHGTHESFAMVRMHATLAEAIEEMDRSGARLVLVTDSDDAVPERVYGVLTRDRIEAGARVRV